MGVKQSKRSVDITETSTKGEIEGFGNEGKVEKIIDGVVEKVAANGHVDADLQNGIEPLQNGVEVIQNGEAATVATEISEEKNVDQLPIEGVVNGQVENGEVNGEAEKPEEGKKSKEKLDKKGKKEKLFRKKFSFRSLSFSKKDKSKPLKEEKSAEKVDETETEEALTSPEKDIASPSQEKVLDNIKPEEVTNPTSISSETITVTPPKVKGEVETAAAEKLPEVISKAVDDLPPPLPASPPPSEPVEGKIASEIDKLDVPESSSGSCMTDVEEATPSLSNILTERAETTEEMIKSADEIAMETGKQIEEKATNLLKTVEERAGESMRAVGESVTLETTEPKEGNAFGAEAVETKEVQSVADEGKTLVETVSAIPVEISNVDALSPKGEEPIEKHEEGAGESLADIPKDLTDEVTAAAIEISNPDSLEISATIPPPPPVVEAVTGE